jgi:hypothetical protein
MGGACTCFIKKPAPLAAAIRPDDESANLFFADLQNSGVRCWSDRLREGRSLIPALPLIEGEAKDGVEFSDELKLPDVPGTPKFGGAAAPWFREIVRAVFGSWDPLANIRYIREILLLAPKGQSKTSYSAGLMVTAMLMNKRPNAEALFIAPTQKISDAAYDQAAGMIDLSPDLQRRFQTKDHEKTIVDRVNKSEMKVKTFDVNILTGSILIFALLDELHLLIWCTPSAPGIAASKRRSIANACHARIAGPATIPSSSTVSSCAPRRRTDLSTTRWRSVAAAILAGLPSTMSEVGTTWTSTRAATTSTRRSTPVRSGRMVSQRSDPNLRPSLAMRGISVLTTPAPLVLAGIPTKTSVGPYVGC